MSHYIPSLSHHKNNVVLHSDPFIVPKQLIPLLPRSHPLRSTWTWWALNGAGHAFITHTRTIGERPWLGELRLIYSFIHSIACYVKN